MKKIMIFCDDSFLQFRVHLDPFFIKISRFHALPHEKLVTKVILLSLSWTRNQTRDARGAPYLKHKIKILIKEMDFGDKKHEK